MIARHKPLWPGVAGAGLAFWMALGGVAQLATARAAEHLLSNPALTKGAGNSPDAWQTQAWQEGSEYSTYQWTHEEGKSGQLAVTNIKPNDARWAQSLNLSGGWYHFSAEIRAENVGKDQTGASLSVMEDGITSPDLKGTTAWQRVGFYLKIGSKGADLELACRVGGFGSLNTGTVMCRDIQLERVAAPPPGAPAQFNFDLDKIRKDSAEVPIGSPWTLVATFLILIAVSALGWRTFGQTMAPRKPEEEPVKRATDRQAR
jgi:dolichyl-phosphate-mannose-protein mannosyltransferase